MMHLNFNIFRLALIMGSAVVLVAAAPAQSAPGESNLDFLLAGVGLAWLSFMVYLFYMDRKNRDLKREIEELRQEIEGKGD